MASDFEIKILLSQLKDDPRFEEISTQAPLADVEILNEPLFAGLTENTPTLGVVSSNTPMFLNIELDLFHILRFTFADAAKVTSIQDVLDVAKGVREKLKLQESISSLELRTEKFEKLKALAVEKLKVNKDAIDDRTVVKEFLQFLKLGKLEFPFDKVLAKSVEINKAGKNLSSTAQLDANNIIFFREFKFLDVGRVADVIVKPAKSVTTKDNAKVSIRVNRKTFKDSFEKLAVKNELDDFKITKGISDTTRVSQFIIPAKLVDRIEKTKALIEKRLKVFRTVDLSKAELKSELDHLDVTKGVFDSGKVRSTILTPRAVQFLRTFGKTKIFKRLKPVKNTLDIAGAKEPERLSKVQKGLRTKVGFKQVVLPTKSVDRIEKPKTVSEEKKLFGTNVQEQIGSLTVTTRGGFSRKLLSTAQTKIIFEAIKARVAFDRAGASEFITFKRDFKVHLNAGAVDIIKPLSPGKRIEQKTKVRNGLLVPPVRTLTVSNSKAKARASREHLDLRYLFNPLLEVKGSLDSSLRDNFVKKPVVPEKIKVQAGVRLVTREVPNVRTKGKLLEEEKRLTNKRFTSEANTTSKIQADKAAILGFVTEKVAFKDLNAIVAKDLNLTERFSVKEEKQPYNVTKAIKLLKLKLEMQAKVSASPSFSDNAGASIRGTAFIRDEEYTTGAYFLEPYVATVPPGRSRQF